MLNTMEQFIAQQDLIPPGSRVLCAVSGGADSIALLHGLYSLRGKLNFQLAAVHYNHRLRGLESDRDQQFVEQFVQLCCGAQHLPTGEVLPAVPLYIGSGDVAAHAKLQGAGIEETARAMRYAYFRQAAEEFRADRVATGHTANDNAETVLFNLSRGTGLRGLGGIPPRRGEIIRPLLTATRQQVEEYLYRRCLPHMEDSTNQDDRYSRNRIRHQVLPVLEDFAPGFALRLTAAAARLREDEACLAALARERSGQAVLEEGGLSIPAAAIASAPDPIALRALRQLLERLWGEDRSCSAAHLAALLRLCREGGPSARLYLPHDTNACRRYDRLLLLPRLGPIPLEEGPLPLPCVQLRGGWQISCREEIYASQPQRPWDFWLDREAAPVLEVRARRTGDRLTPPGRLGKTVKKWMIEEKLPRFQRDALPVLCCAGRLAAVAGLGPDRAFAARPGRDAWHVQLLPIDRTP